MASAGVMFMARHASAIVVCMIGRVNAASQCNRRATVDQHACRRVTRSSPIKSDSRRQRGNGFGLSQ